MIASARYVVGEALMERDPERAVALFEDSIALARSVRNRLLVGVGLVCAASLRARHGDPREALRSFRDMIDHWRVAGDWTHLWIGMRSLVELLARLGANAPAVVLHAAVVSAHTAPPPFGADADRLHAVAADLEDRLSPEALAAGRARGEAMADQEAVALARAEIDRLIGSG